MRSNHLLIKSSLLSFTAFLVIGCGQSPEKQIVGHWNYEKMNVTNPAFDTPQIEAAMKSMNLDFTADKKYNMGQATLKMTGTYTIKDKSVTMNFESSNIPQITEIMKRGPKKQETATLSDDGKTLTMAAGSTLTSSGSIIFTKAK